MDYYIGLMSGTSMDAIDAALFLFHDDSVKLIDTHSIAFPETLKLQLVALLQNNNISLTLLGETDAMLGELFAEAVLGLLKKSSFSREKINAIGSHGQTIYHSPHGKYPFTLQIGDPNIIVAKTGITTVADFRRRDIAVGGQGAPLAPAFHAWLLPRDEKNQWVLNLGGIANITYLPANKNEKIIGFDTGPANTLLDQWCEKHTGKIFDKDGQWARNGKIIPALLKKLLDDAYFKKPFPKSTGREYFNLAWLSEKMIGISAESVDIQATLTELTAKTIADAIIYNTTNTHILWLCGGGANNAFLIERLRSHLPYHAIYSTEKIGIHPQWIECAAFAWLAKQTLEKKPGNLESVTGADKKTILGGIYLADN